MESQIIYSSKLYGEYSPYIAVKEGKAIIYDTIQDAINDNPKKRYELDVAAVLSLLNYSYILGDRTLIVGISRVPWHSEVTIDGSIKRNAPISHDDVFLENERVANKLYELLSVTIKEKILKIHKTIWLTLSGGMDSRIVSLVVKKNMTSDNKVNVLNWGIPNSRNVEYAKKIASHFNWSYNYVPFVPEYEKELVNYAVTEGGAEISPINYNPLETNPEFIDKIKPEDAIIFSHYGDGVGRGEIAGRRVNDIRLLKLHNPYYLFNPWIVDEYLKTIELDRQNAWSPDNSKESVKKVAIGELHMHENYMRRVFLKRFKYCSRFDPFVDDKIINFIYSLSPKSRNDEAYRIILRSNDTFLYDLPWAKTGISMSGKKETNRDITIKQHNKLKWYFDNNYMEIKTKIINGYLVNSAILNPHSLKFLMDRWPTDLKLSMLFSRLYNIELFIEKFNIVLPDFKGMGGKGKVKYYPRLYYYLKLHKLFMINGDA